MTVVSTREFNTHQEKYFDLALNEQVYVKRGRNMFIVAKASEPEVIYKEPDDDLRTAITKDELLEGLYGYIDKMFAVNG